MFAIGKWGKYDTFILCVAIYYNASQVGSLCKFLTESATLIWLFGFHFSELYIT